MHLQRTIRRRSTSGMTTSGGKEEGNHEKDI
jgi:hypothetical protein